MIRFFDIFFSGLAIVVLLPFMIPIMIALKLTGEHDIFYKQKRIGKGGKEFFVLKFATMLRNSPNMAGGLVTLENDPRILPLGNFLRKTKINELPQLVNIFIGQMSVIGPRPQAVAHYALYSDDVKNTISKVPPGLSGVGSIVFRGEEDILHSVDDPNKFHDTIIVPYKGEIEKWFVANRNIKTYFKCIFWTVAVVLNPKSCDAFKVFKGLPAPPKELEKYLKK